MPTSGDDEQTGGLDDGLVSSLVFWEFGRDTRPAGYQNGAFWSRGVRKLLGIIELPLEDADDSLRDLIFLGLDHGIGSVRDAGETLIPFVLAEEKKGSRELVRFVAGTFEESVEKAYDFVRKRMKDFERIVVVYDGFATVEGVRYDTIFALGCVRGKKETFLFGQRYTPKTDLQGFQAIGNAAYFGEGNVDLGLTQT
jgi:hypothetical protein